MKTAEIVLYQDKRQGNGSVTVEEVIKTTKHFQHAGTREVEYFVAHPEKTPEILSEGPLATSATILFCGDILTHENGSEYVEALYREKSKGIVVGKYWLADPLPISFHMALLH
jgi:hypothetical protein